jgi:hypothetical protein
MQIIFANHGESPLVWMKSVLSDLACAVAMKDADIG